jgi:hypothetical protein
MEEKQIKISAIEVRTPRPPLTAEQNERFLAAGSKLVQSIIEEQEAVYKSFAPYQRQWEEANSQVAEMASRMSAIVSPALLEFAKVDLQVKEASERLMEAIALPNFPIPMSFLDRTEVVIPVQTHNSRAVRIENVDEIVEKTFSKVVEKFAIAEPQIETQKKRRASTTSNVIFLSTSGDLYRQPKTKYCYKLRQLQYRAKLIRAISNNFLDTEHLQLKSGYGNKLSLRKAIGELNAKAKTFLKLKDKLIEGKPGSGYRLNPVYKLKFPNN